MKNTGAFVCSLVIFLCGFAILMVFALAAPAHVWIETPHFVDWLSIAGAGLLAFAVGGIGMTFSA